MRARVGAARSGGVGGGSLGRPGRRPRGAPSAACQDATPALARQLRRAPASRGQAERGLLIRKGRGSGRALSAEAQRRRDAEPGQPARPLHPSMRVRSAGGPHHQFRARGGAGNGPERAAAPGPRVTHRLKCSMIFSSRTFSGKLPTQRCLVSRTMLGGVPATAGAGSPSPASYEPVSVGRRTPRRWRRRRRRLRRWRRQRRRLLRLPPVQRPSLSPRF